MTSPEPNDAEQGSMKLMYADFHAQPEIMTLHQAKRCSMMLDYAQGCLVASGGRVQKREGERRFIGRVERCREALRTCELSDRKVYEPSTRARLGTAAHFLSSRPFNVIHPDSSLVDPTHGRVECRREALRTRGGLTKPEWLTGKKTCSGSEVGSYLRLVDSCITQL